MAIDRGSHALWLTGNAFGQVAGAPEPFAGGQDGFLAGFDEPQLGTGSFSAVHMFGTSGFDFTAAIAVHLQDIYIAGRTFGSFPEHLA